MLKSLLLIQALKILVAVLFFFSATCTNVVVTVFVIGDRINLKTEPSKDVLFEILPENPKAFAIAEICTISLVVLLILTVLLNKFNEKMNILFRFFLLEGFMLYLRAMCIAITVFPVPSSSLHAKCSSFIDKVKQNKYDLFLSLLLGAGTSGMNEQIATCGDYVFSGHTLTLTVFSFFVRRYLSSLYKTSYPLQSLFIKMLTYLLNIIGMICIIISREHYTVDVVLGFYLSLIVCQYYHSLVFTFHNLKSTDKSKNLFKKHHPLNEFLLIPFFKEIDNNNHLIIQQKEEEKQEQV